MPKNKYFPDVETPKGYSEFVVGYGISIRFRLQRLASRVSAQQTDKDKINIFRELAEGFLKGQPVSVRGDDPFPNFPERTGNAETDLQNFNDYFQEFFEKYPKITEATQVFYAKETANYFNTYLQQNPLKDYAKALGQPRSFSDTRFMLESTLGADHRLSGEHLESEKMSRFELFRSVTLNHAIKKEPEWYEFGKRFNMWREKRALNKLEANLKALGFPQETLENVKNGQVQNKDEVRNSIQKTAVDRMSVLRDTVTAEDNQLDQEFVTDIDSPKGKRYLANVMKVYKETKALHDASIPQNDDEKKYYQQEEKLLKEMKIQITNTMNLSTPEYKQFFESLFDPNVNVKDALRKREQELEKANRPIEKEIVDFDEKIFEDDSLDKKMNKAIYTREKQIDALYNQQEKENQQLNNNILQEDENEVQGPQQG